MLDFTERLNQLREAGFIIKPDTIEGDEVVLINPSHMGTPWTKDNMIYRSSIWTMDGKPVSLSFRKFFNWGERTDLTPIPESLTNAIAMEKLDGSTLISSKYKSKLITRTRGTFDASTLDNGYELPKLISKYPTVFNNSLINSQQYSIICEWVSPNNVIVLKYGNEPDIYLTAIIDHKDYTYMSQKELDKHANNWGIKRPKQFFYNDVKSMLETVKDLKDQEGICIYFNDGQDILKAKSADYLAKHAFKSNLTVNNIVDIYYQWNQPVQDDFLLRIEREFDYECKMMAIDLVKNLYDATTRVNIKINRAKEIANTLVSISRKEAANFILNNYKETSDLIFSALNNKPIRDSRVKDMILEVMKDDAA